MRLDEYRLPTEGIISLDNTLVSGDPLSMVSGLLRQIVDVNDVVLAFPDNREDAKLDEQVDWLLELLLVFYSEDPSVDDVRAVLSNTPRVSSGSDLVDLPESVIPLVIFRNLFNIHKVMVCPKRIRNLPIFLSRYEKQVLAV